MSIYEIITLVLSVCATIISVSSLYFTRRWNNQAFQRETRLPYYQELKKKMAEVYVLYDTNVDRLGIYRTPDLSDYITRAETIALYDISFGLKEVVRVIAQAERTHKNRDYELSVESCQAICRAVNKIEDFIFEDIGRLTGSEAKRFRNFIERKW